ncbi:hypothetical protein T492DRAFT_858999 [Pavlovales sp. CCMP2436]|nr:hypothetical protein T492DRAFT_858999 [Pavlovales sp. CCMP2436]
MANDVAPRRYASCAGEPLDVDLGNEASGSDEPLPRRRTLGGVARGLEAGRAPASELSPLDGRSHNRSASDGEAGARGHAHPPRRLGSPLVAGPRRALAAGRRALSGIELRPLVERLPSLSHLGASGSIFVNGTRASLLNPSSANGELPGRQRPWRCVNI